LPAIPYRLAANPAAGKPAGGKPDVDRTTAPTPQPQAAPSVSCPKCGHVRASTDTAPTWQCPACGIAYHKYAAYRDGLRRAAAIPKAGDRVPRVATDRSVWLLLAANVAALVIALVGQWNTTLLMAAYWAQSVIIGGSNVFRILALDRFSTEGLKMNDRPVDPTPATKRQVAGFFALHYGIFHAAYLAFLLAETKAGLLFDGWFWLCTAAFGANHLWSYRYNRALDREGTPNLGTLMFTPYLRVIPMHLTIVLGGLFVNSGFGLLLFGGLKTLADVAMHLVEHAQLRKVRGAAAQERS
jgi:ribosomal protein L37AE/L43A